MLDTNTMVQSVINAIDAQITKTRSPITNVLILTPLLIIVSLPLAVIVGTVVIMAVGTTGSVGQNNATPGIIAGVLTVLLFWAWAAYGTYSYSNGA